MKIEDQVKIEVNKGVFMWDENNQTGNNKGNNRFWKYLAKGNLIQVRKLIIDLKDKSQLLQ